MMYNPQLDTFLCVVEGGKFQQGSGTVVYIGSGGHQTDQFA